MIKRFFRRADPELVELRERATLIPNPVFNAYQAGIAAGTAAITWIGVQETARATMALEPGACTDSIVTTGGVLAGLLFIKLLRDWRDESVEGLKKRDIRCEQSERAALKMAGRTGPTGR